MNKIFFLGVGSVMLLSACTGGDKVIEVSEITEVCDSLEESGDTLDLFEEEVVPVTADQLFNDFLYSFVSDWKFQMSRVSFPLSYKKGEEDLRIGLEEWKEQHEQLLANEYYVVIYEREHELELLKDTALCHVDVEWIDMKEKQIEKFNFGRNEGKWCLTRIEKNSFSLSPNSGFLEFYCDFASDSVFQQNAIDFPLKYVFTSDEDEDDVSDLELSVEEWEQLKEEIPLPKNGFIHIDYGQTSISQNRKTFLLQGVSNGLFLKYKYRKDGEGLWKLYEIEN